MLLTTFLNPGFDPKIQFSSYGDPTIAVVLAFAAWQAERVLAALAGDRAVAEEMATTGVIRMPVVDRETGKVCGSISAQELLVGRRRAVVRESERGR